MLRVLLCISCCSAPPQSNQTGKRVRRSSSKKLPNGASNEIQNEELVKKQSTEGEDTNERDRLLANQAQDASEGYGTKQDSVQGNLNLPSDATKDDRQLIEKGPDAVAVSAGAKLQRANAIDTGLHSDLKGNETGLPLQYDGNSGSMLSSIEIGPFTESYSTTASYYREETQISANNLGAYTLEQHQAHRNVVATDEGAPVSSQQYGFLEASAKDVPSTTKIGDYARIEYSPVEDLESLTTMSYSRFGSEKGGNRSLPDSALSRQNSLKTNALTGGSSRRSSQGGIESTSISIASQLSNEQFQQNLTNMLESVNTNYQTIGGIGLPSIDGIQPETTKTSPETPGAALTSASQDSLSDTAFDDVSTLRIRPETGQSNVSSGAALVGDSVERSNLVDELAELSQSAPLAVAEDDDNSTPRTRLVTKSVNVQDSLSAERVGSPQSIATTTSGGLTNPTPTPSEMSSGSGKKKRLKAKALFKKLKPGSRKKNKENLE